jgi:hypothetical protein
MNCLDCARREQRAAPAIAACIECGAGVCDRHAVERAVPLVRIESIGREVPVEPRARALRCARCDVARQATRGPARASIGRRRSKEHA